LGRKYLRPDRQRFHRCRYHADKDRDGYGLGSSLRGGLHSLALKSTGALYAWGSNTYYQFGDGSQTDRGVPGRTGTDTTWSTISAGGNHYSLALKSNGTLWAWGANANGQIGDGSLTDRKTPYTTNTILKYYTIDAAGNPSPVQTQTYVINYLLTVSKPGIGSGTVTSEPSAINCGADCAKTFGVGSTVTLTAIADIGSAFTGWSGETCLGTGTCTVTMSGTKNVSANFALTNRAYWTLDGQEIRTLFIQPNSRKTLRLKAEVPPGKILRAYSATVTYDSSKLALISAVFAPDVPFSSYITTTTQGEVSFGGFSATGISGPTTLPFVDVTFQSIDGGTSSVVPTFSAFGYDSGDRFEPTPPS
jgi:hypothetical protein